MTCLTQIRTFVLIIELGSLAAASRKLKISSAAVSKQLNKLEEEIGAQLLVRSTRRIELTDVGKSYFQQCKKIIEEVDVASALISQMKVVPNGTLKVVSGRHFASSYILPHIKEFLTKYPHIELNLELAERVPDLNSESIDVVIGMSISATGDVIQKKISTTSYVLCASPKYLKHYGIPNKPDDLKNHRYISHCMRNPDNEIIFNDKKRVTVNPYIRVNDAQALLNFALEDLGIVMLHHYVVKESLEKGLLQAFLSNYLHKDIPIYVAYPQRRFVASKIRCFIDFISEKIKN